MRTRTIAMLLAYALVALDANAQVKIDAGGFWEKTKDASRKAVDATRDRFNELTESKEEAKEGEQGDTRAEQAAERLRDMWAKALPKLEQAIGVKDRMRSAPDKRFIGTDKRSLKRDFDEILDGLSVILGGTGLSEYHRQIEGLKSQIDTARREILTCREKRPAAPEKHLVYRTKKDYDERIEKLEKDVTTYEKQIVAIRDDVKQRLTELGIDLPEDQVEVLLSRVDSNNIAQMCEATNSVKLITSRLMAIMRESGEDIECARRYYGMHVVLVECIMHVHRKYIDEIDGRYVPKIQNLMDEAEGVRKTSARELAREKAPVRRKVYEGNMRAQDLTLKTARLYQSVLKGQRGKLETAMQKLDRDLALAQNTYDTVRVSAELLSIVKASENTFKALMDLQAPALVPFENVEMQRKFEEISALISK